jgi:hypothetical protein
VSDDAQAADPADLEARLRVLDALPVDQHVAIYDGLHRELRDQLAGAPGSLDASDGAPYSKHADSRIGADVSHGTDAGAPGSPAGPDVAAVPHGAGATGGPAASETSNGAGATDGPVAAVGSTLEHDDAGGAPQPGS